MEAVIYEVSFWLPAEGIDVFGALGEQLQASGHTVLNTVSHQFEPQGYTCLWLLAESHCAMHTYPEHGTVYVQMSSCSYEKYQRFMDGIAARYPDFNPVENVSRP